MRSILLITAVALAGCVTQRVDNPPGLGSFEVEIVSIDPWTNRPAGCEEAPETGSAACPRPFIDAGSPLRLRLRARALDRRGLLRYDATAGADVPAPDGEVQLFSFNGLALVDVRPGRVAEVGPGGKLVTFSAGLSEGYDSGGFELALMQASGATRIWIEHCGTAGEPGTFATGLSPELFFESPRIDQINLTDDNTTSPLVPRANNVCAISGDPRFGLGMDENGVVGFVGYSHGRRVNAPPPAIGDYLEISGCSRAQLDRLHEEGKSCDEGPLVVTGIDNGGFFVVDYHPDSVARGFNNIYAFNFNYPNNLEAGDLLVSLQGSPMEFTGSTQLRNPSWRRDGVGKGRTLLRPAVRLAPEVYAAAIESFGRNRAEETALEALEAAVVCVENVAPASVLTDCDTNSSGSIERTGCLLSGSLPPRCDEYVGVAPAPPLCDETSLRPFCLAMTAEEIEACELSTFLPANPPEYCCERACYRDIECSERSAYVGLGQWVGDVNGDYDPTEAEPVKLAFMTRDADPEFDPFAFGSEQRTLPPQARKHLRITGNLRQVLAARPVWVVIARQPSDIAVMEEAGGCP